MVQTIAVLVVVIFACLLAFVQADRTGKITFAVIMGIAACVALFGGLALRVG